MNQRFDSACAHVRLEIVPRIDQQWKQVIDVPGVEFTRHTDARVLQAGTIASGDCAAPCGPRRQVAETGAEDSGLHLVEPRVHTKLIVLITRRLTAVA